jgi:hypothetical protein
LDNFVIIYLKRILFSNIKTIKDSEQGIRVYELQRITQAIRLARPSPHVWPKRKMPRCVWV